VPNTTNIRDYLDGIHVAEKTQGLAHFLMDITKNEDFQMVGLIAGIAILLMTQEKKCIHSILCRLSRQKEPRLLPLSGA